MVAKTSNMFQKEIEPHAGDWLDVEDEKAIEAKPCSETKRGVPCPTRRFEATGGKTTLRVNNTHRQRLHARHPTTETAMTPSIEVENTLPMAEKPVETAPLADCTATHEEHQYLDLIREILETGEHRPDR
jgi:hypothetical protein